MFTAYEVIVVGDGQVSFNELSFVFSRYCCENVLFCT